MKQSNDKKDRRMIIHNTKEALKKYSDFMKQQYGIEIPKDIFNMDNASFYVYLEDVLSPAVHELPADSIELMEVVCKVEACLRAFEHYEREMSLKDFSLS